MKTAAEDEEERDFLIYWHAEFGDKRHRSYVWPIEFVVRARHENEAMRLLAEKIKASVLR